MQATAPQLLDREFLTIRARLIDLASALDRLARGEGSVQDDPRWGQIDRALAALRRPGDDRTEELQLIFSRPYDDGWQEKFRMTNDE